MAEPQPKSIHLVEPYRYNACHWSCSSGVWRVSAGVYLEGGERGSPETAGGRVGQGEAEEGGGEEERRAEDD